MVGENKKQTYNESHRQRQEGEGERERGEGGRVDTSHATLSHVQYLILQVEVSVSSNQQLDNTSVSSFRSKMESTLSLLYSKGCNDIITQSNTSIHTSFCELMST